MENTDYCAAAVLDHRYPDKKVSYIEEDTAFEIDGKRLEPNFDMVTNPPVELMDTGDGYSWVAEVVITLEVLFDMEN